tara:strand:+ start:685 stop:1875 length:1191 start_codon:yes stop_codon:yes gene_type:complete
VGIELTMKITVFGCGYVGMSISVLLAQKYDVITYDIDSDRISAINRNLSPIKDEGIESFLKNGTVKLYGTDNKDEAMFGRNLFIIATPTNYDPDSNYFDTTSVESVISEIIAANKNCSIVIKSTIPIGFVDKLRSKYDFEDIYFSPEFLREGSALHDNLYPSRVVIGGDNDFCEGYIQMMLSCAIAGDIPTYMMGTKEAEATKLFANTYLAMRVAYFNELDSFALGLGLNAKDIVNGISSDPRIMQGYNNPSFGYGGYCLPKDTKQLRANFRENNVHSSLIGAIVDSNNDRKRFLAAQVNQRGNGPIGIYKLAMKSGSDNFRESAIFDLIEDLRESGRELLIYEPGLFQDKYNGITVEHDLAIFIQKSVTILANRVDDVLAEVSEKVFSRDIFGDN